MSADALIPILIPLQVVLATSSTTSGAARVVAEVERTPCDPAVSWHVHTSRVPNVQAMPGSGSHVVRCIRR